MFAPAPIYVSNLVTHNARTVDQIYRFYKESIKTFSPNLNSPTVLLYVYKLFFNVKNKSFTPEGYDWLNKLLV